MPGQRLLAQIDLFENPGVVLEDPKYWNPDFARCFIEAWGGVAFDDPHAGFRVAETAVDLVGHLDEEARRVLRPRALATVGSSYRALEELVKAEEVFREVLALHAKTLVPRLDEADFFRRIAYLRADERQWGEAIDFSNRAIVLCQAEQATHELGMAYGALGAIYLSMIIHGASLPAGEPVASLTEALKRVDPRHGPHTYEASMGNLAQALLHGYPCDLERALTTLKEAARFHARRRVTRKTLPNAQLRWVIGLVYLRIGSVDSLHRAIQILRRARRRLMEFGIAEKVVYISLDLAQAHAALRQWGRLRILAEEILSLEGGFAKESLAALQAWRWAILHEHVPASVWMQVLDKVRWSPLAFPKKRQRQPIVFRSPLTPQPPPLW